MTNQLFLAALQFTADHFVCATVAAFVAAAVSVLTVGAAYRWFR